MGLMPAGVSAEWVRNKFWGQEAESMTKAQSETLNT